MSFNLRNALSNAFVGSGGGDDATKLPLTGGTLTGPLTITGGTVTDSTPLLSLTQTWNDAADTFHLDTANVTNTASQAASTLLRRQVGGVDIFSVRRDGKVQMRGSGGSNDMLFSVLTAQGNGFPVFNLQDGGAGIGAGWIVGYGNSAGAAMQFQRGLELGSSCALAWGTGGPLQQTQDTALARISAGVLGLTNASTGGAAFEFTEISDPAAPASNKARFYAKDNGSGKTQLVVVFPTGAVQVIATEP
jgi:hypothetical protein